MANQYVLRAELRGHEEDVRGLTSSDANTIFTSSRDKTVKLWSNTGDKFDLAATLVGHTGYVGPLAFVPAGAVTAFPNGALISGSRDNNVIIWDLASASPLATLSGHTYQVTAVGFTSDGTVISASLDKSIKVWRDGKCVKTLAGHDGPVLSMVVLSDNEVLSGSGDTTIRRWNLTTGACVQVIQGHTDTVRGLALLPNVGFVSGSHDHTIKVWTLEGQVVAELVGHTAIIYSVAATADGLIASGSEDNTAKLWRASGECLQTIEHPGCVWDVHFLSDATLVTAASDAAARLWTPNADQQGDAETLEAYNMALQSFKAGSSKEGEQGEAGGSGGGLPAGLKVEEAAVLQEPGKKDGETKIVREGGGAVAYSWNATTFQWEKIGEVVAGPGEGAGPLKKMYKGVEWDYVFDVDIGEGMPPRKLAGNRDENPYIVADRFIEEEELPAYFKEQIVQFILENTGQAGGVQLPSNMPITGGFCDPFTGGSSTSSDPPPPRPALPQQPVPMDITGGGVDPFTGTSSSSSSRQAPPATPSSAHLPAASFLLFDSRPNPAPLLKKLNEFNSVLAASESAQLALEPPELQALESLTAKAAAGGKGVGVADVALLRRLLTWPAAQIFPVLDLTRLVVLDPAAAAQLGAAVGQLDAPQPGTLAGALSAAAASSLQPAHQTALRLTCNLFMHDSLRAWVATSRGTLLDVFAPCASSPGKAVRGGLAALLHNLAILLTTGYRDDVEGQMQVMSALSELLSGSSAGGAAQEDPETMYRALVAAGTLAMVDADSRSLAKDLGIADAVKEVAAAASADKVRQVAADVVNVLK